MSHVSFFCSRLRESPVCKILLLSFRWRVETRRKNWRFFNPAEKTARTFAACGSGRMDVSMVFSSLIFLYLFLPVCLILYFLARKMKVKNIILLVLSPVSYTHLTADELPPESIRKAKSIGVTAGASTPASIIKEVLFAMSEILNNEPEKELEQTPEVKVEETVETPEKSFDEMTFEEALEASFKNYNTGEKVHGVVVSIAPNEVQVDVGRKQAGYIPADELSNDPNAKPEDLVKVGDELDLLIIRTNDQEGTIMLSKRRFDAIKGWEEIVKASEDDTVVDGKVVEIIKGGVLAVSNGVRVFIPASQATLSRNEPLDGLLNKEVKFKIIEVNRGRRRAVGSIRKVASEERKKLEEKFWETAEVGQKYTGVVKSLSLIHISRCL